MGPERTPLALLAMLVALSPSLTACANQKDVTPLLRVDPNAASRFLYFEKRAAAMIRERRGPEPEPAETCAIDEPPAPRTWGAPEPGEGLETAPPQDDAEPQGTSCDRAQND